MRLHRAMESTGGRSSSGGRRVVTVRHYGAAMGRFRQSVRRVGRSASGRLPGLVATALAGLALAETLAGDATRPRVLYVPVALVMTVPLAAIRRYPLPV